MDSGWEDSEARKMTALSPPKAPSPSRISMTSCCSRSEPKARPHLYGWLGVPAAATALPNPSHIPPCWLVPPTC